MLSNLHCNTVLKIKKKTKNKQTDNSRVKKKITMNNSLFFFCHVYSFKVSKKKKDLRSKILNLKNRFPFSIYRVLLTENQIYLKSRINYSVEM